MKPYILFYSYDDHGFETLYPVFQQAKKQFDCTLLYAANNDASTFLDCNTLQEKRLGLQGKNFKLHRLAVERKPSAVVGFRLWWTPDIDPAMHACSLGIPVIMVNHGHMFVYNEKQTYKKNFGPASINCIWGHWDYILWRRWTQMPLEITGNPLHDTLPQYKDCEPVTKQKHYALLLTPRGQRNILNPSAAQLSKIMPVVASCHPLDKKKNFYAKRYETHTRARDMLPLIRHASVILSNVTSSLISALYWRKPIFIHSFGAPGYHFDEFKRMFIDVFNFKENKEWSEYDIGEAKRPKKNDFLTFGHYPDGKNSQRVLQVIKRYL